MRTIQVICLLLLSVSVFAQEDLIIDTSAGNSVGEVTTTVFSSPTVSCPPTTEIQNLGAIDLLNESMNTAYNTLSYPTAKKQRTTTSPGKTYPNNCDHNARGTNRQYLRYGIVMARGYYCKKLRPRKFLNYGCYCGSSNAGLNTVPSDGIDRACQQHDHNLWAICQGAAYNNPDGRPCNCYENTPIPKCSNGEIQIPKGLSACEKACLEDVIELTNDTKKALKEYSSKRYHPKLSFKGGDMSRELPFCSGIFSQFPVNRFGPFRPEPELLRRVLGMGN